VEEQIARLISRGSFVILPLALKTILITIFHSQRSPNSPPERNPSTRVNGLENLRRINGEGGIRWMAPIPWCLFGLRIFRHVGDKLTKDTAKKSNWLRQIF